MRASQYLSPGCVELVQTPDPTPQPGEVVVRLDRATICGSDLHALYDSLPHQYPFPPGVSGHECVGVVVEPNGASIPSGERVLIIPPLANAFVDYLAVAATQLIPLPDSLPSELGVLAQQLGTVIFCCRKLHNVIDKTVVVIGQGPVGLFFTALLYRMGAKQVIGLDLVEARLTLARAWGAETVNVADEDPVEAVRALTGGQLADVVVEAVGKRETINLCPDLARSGAELALFGIPKQSALLLDYEKFFRRQLRTVSSAYTQTEPGFRSFRLAIDFITQRRLDVVPLISHRVPFSHIQQAFWLAETKNDGAIKVLLKFDD